MNVNGVSPDIMTTDMNKDKEAKPQGLELTIHEDEHSIVPGKEIAAASNIANDEEVQTAPHQQDTVVEQYTQLTTKTNKTRVHVASADVN